MHGLRASGGEKTGMGGGELICVLLKPSMRHGPRQLGQ